MPSGGQNLKKTPEIELDIINRFSKGETMLSICNAVDINPQTLMNWRKADPLFDSDILCALEVGFEIQADSLLTIYDTEQDTNKARGKSDNLKWVLARRAASRYGDKITMDVNNTIDIKGALLDAKARVGQLLQSAQSRIEQAIDVTPQLADTATDNESVEETDPDLILLRDMLK